MSRHFVHFFFSRLSFSGSGGTSVANLVALGSKVAARRPKRLFFTKSAVVPYSENDTVSV